MHRKDESLVKRLQKGDRKAMEELYDLYSPVLLNVAMRYSKSREDAEDLLHESLLKILKAIDAFKPTFEGSFVAWMKKITVNLCLSNLKKKSDHLGLVDQTSMAEEQPNEDHQNEDSLPDLPAEEVLAMLRTLPTGYQTVLNLFVFEKMSHKEIAKELNISENTSKSQLFKARAAMRRLLYLPIENKEVAR